MPFRQGIATYHKYAAVEQNEIYLDQPNGNETYSNSLSEHGGSDVSRYEMGDMEHDTAIMSDLEALDQETTFWSRSRKKLNSGCLHDLTLLCCSKCCIKESLYLCIAFLLVTVLVISVSTGSSPDKSVCTKRECVTMAGQISDALDESVAPCDDFYEFACGGWERNNPLPSGHSKWDNFAVQKRAIETALKNVLDSTVNTDGQQESYKKARDFYQKCLDLPAINKYGLEPMKVLIEKFGGWSLSEDKDWSAFDLNDLLNKLATYGLSPYVGLVVGVDLKNASCNIIRVVEGSMNLAKRKFYINKTLDDPILKAYLDYMTGVCMLFGGNETYSRRLMEDIMHLEKRIAEIQMPAEVARHGDLYYKHVTLPELQELAPAIKWTERLSSLYTSAFPEEQLDLSMKLGTSASDYLMNITKIIRNTANETLNNYAIWQLVTEFVPALGQDFIDLRAKLSKQTSGSDSSCVERWRTCVAGVDSMFGSVLGKLFVEKYFNNDSRDMAEEMVREIKDAFKRNFPAATWLDKETEQKALEKVNAVKNMIGYPDDIFNHTKLDEDYFDLQLSEHESYFEMHVGLAKLFAKENIKSLRKPVDKDKWEMTPPTVNAYYSPLKNSIVFPAGILQPPAYSKNYPQSFNFGGMGFVVGHELTHGFDDDGRRYDLSGNAEDWWENKTAHEFQKKAKCMVEQYSNFQLNGHNVNGNLTLGENIADNGGIRVAYHAYLQWRKTGDPDKDPLLPSLHYSHQQLFFIASAQLWCSTSSTKYDRLSLLNSHSPNKIRVLGFSMNSPEFADAFSCPPGSRMNPVHKCRVW